MKYRLLGKTGYNVSEISLGTWQVGGKWGSEFDDANADRIIRTAIDHGINFIDTADVYSNGLSEKAVGRAIKSSKEKIYIATKCGRQINPHINENYNTRVLRKYVEDSLSRLNIDIIDLIQLHCPPNDVYYRPEIFGLFEDLKTEGKIQCLGVSVEKVEQAIKAIEFENVCSVQIIFNVLRQRPKELFFKLAKERNIGIIARVPLASGLLSGLYSSTSVFSAGDHRHFNRNGEAFDKGETFSGIDYDLGLKVVEELKTYFQGRNLIDVALQWILTFQEVSCVIPGASNEGQVVSQVASINAKELQPEDLNFLKDIYNKYIKSEVHHLW